MKKVTLTAALSTALGKHEIGDAVELPDAQADSLIALGLAEAGAAASEPLAEAGAAASEPPPESRATRR